MIIAVILEEQWKYLYIEKFIEILSEYEKLDFSFEEFYIKFLDRIGD